MWQSRGLKGKQFKNQNTVCEIKSLISNSKSPFVKSKDKIWNKEIGRGIKNHAKRNQSDKFWNLKFNLSNQSDKFWKSKNHSRNQKSRKRNQSETFWESKCHLRKQTIMILEIEISFEKSNDQILEIRRLFKKSKITQ